MNYYDDVKQFHDKFGLVTPPDFFQIPTDLYEFRVKFFVEEYDEYVESVEKNDLPIAIDSLIDLVYITMGAALLHGIKNSFDLPRANSLAFPRQSSPTTPHFLDPESHEALKAAITGATDRYRAAYVKADEVAITEAFNDLHFSCLNGAAAMGFNQARWDILWADVQRANMAKERALRADQSKRGSTYDVIKPAGWIAPRSEELVNQMLNGEI